MKYSKTLSAAQSLFSTGERGHFALAMQLRCSLRVKIGKAQVEHYNSALHPLATQKRKTSERLQIPLRANSGRRDSADRMSIFAKKRFEETR